MRIRIQIERGGAPRPERDPAAATSRRRRKLLLTLLVVGMVGAVAGYGTYSAFTATTTNTGNTLAAGSVAIEDNDLDGAMLAITNGKPNDTDVSCIKIKYTGSLGATVRLYASTLTGSLPAHITLVVTRGTGAAAYDNCTGFTADGTNYGNGGNGIVYNGKLGNFPTTYAGGIVDPTSGSPESWTNGEEHWYRFAVTVDDTNAAQGLTGTAGFTWEARNE
jgi:hypothetical protein